MYYYINCFNDEHVDYYCPFTNFVNGVIKLTNKLHFVGPGNIFNLVMIPLQPYRKDVTITVNRKENLDY